MLNLYVAQIWELEQPPSEFHHAQPSHLPGHLDEVLRCIRWRIPRFVYLVNQLARPQMHRESAQLAWISNLPFWFPKSIQVFHISSKTTTWKKHLNPTLSHCPSFHRDLRPFIWGASKNLPFPCSVQAQNWFLVASSIFNFTTRFVPHSETVHLPLVSITF